MNINVIYGQGAANNAAPSGFYAAVNYVVNYFDNLFSSNVTININVSYGAVLDPYSNSYSQLGFGALGGSYQNSENIYNYTSVLNALLSEHAPGASILPSSSPVPGSFYLGSAEAKALGLQGASSALDGSIGIASNTSWDYSATATPTANQYYLIGVLEHEISEVMGRTSNLDTGGFYSVADLYRYSSPGVRDLTTGGHGSVAYFSIDNGTTNLGNWNNQISNGDLGDWYPQGPAAGGNDSFNDYSSSGVINSVSSTDITLMQALGWGAPVTTAHVQNVINDSISELYVGYFNRAAAPSGEAYWLGRLNGIGGPAMTEAQIAASFSVQPEATGLYPFLANPSLNEPTNAQTFVNSVFGDLFNRAPTYTNGHNYWVDQLLANLGNPQVTGNSIVNIISGAQGADTTTLQNKVTVATYFTDHLSASGLPFGTAALTEAHGIIAATTSNPATVVTEEHNIDAFLASGGVTPNVQLVGLAESSAHIVTA